MGPSTSTSTTTRNRSRSSQTLTDVNSSQSSEMFLSPPAKDSENLKGEISENANARGGRRRAAAQAVGSLKELPTNKKLRQGDQQFNKSFQYSQSIQKDDRTKENKDSNALKSRK